MSRQTRATRRALDRHGRDVTLRNYTNSGSDDYGENWTTTAGSPYTVTARVDYRTQLTEVRDTFGTDVDSTANIYIRDDVAGGVAEIRDGGGEGATEIDLDGQTYVVLVMDNQDNGLLNLQSGRYL